MKITYIENVRFPSERAHAIQILHTCQELGKLGHEVLLVTPNRRGTSQYHDMVPNGTKITFHHHLLSCVDALAIAYIPKQFAYYLQRWSFIVTCRAWKRTQHSEIWYTRDSYLLGKLFTPGERWVLELHNIPNEGLWKKIRVLVKKFVVISRPLQDWLIQRGVSVEDVCIAPDGWDPASHPSHQDRNEARTSLGWGRDGVVFIYAGGLFPWKGVDRVVQWWNQHPLAGAKLIILGGTDADRARISSLTSSSSIQILRPVPPIDVSRFLQAADVGILPTSPEHEIGRLYTSPLKLFEYLSMGLPILASDVPSSREILDESVAKFFSDQASFYAARQKIMSDAAWKKEAQEQAKKRSLFYTWSARAKKIDAVLHTL